MEDALLFSTSSLPPIGGTPSDLDSSMNLTSYPFFTSPTALSPFQTLERSGKQSTSFLGSGSKILAESFDAALQALSRHSQPASLFTSPSESMQRRPGLPSDFKKPASSIGSSAPSSATSDTSDVLADRLDSDFDADISADSISLGSHRSGLDSWSISPSPVLGETLSLPEVMPVPSLTTAAMLSGTIRSDSSEMAADIFAQFISEDSAHGGENADTIRGLPMMTPQRPSLFRDLSAMTSGSSVATSASMVSTPATPLDNQFTHRPGFGLLDDLGSPRKNSASMAPPHLLARSHSQMEHGVFANVPAFASAVATRNAIGLADPNALFNNVVKHVNSPLPSPAFIGYLMEAPMLSCNPAHIAPADMILSKSRQEQQAEQQRQDQLKTIDGMFMLQLDGHARASSPLKRPATDCKRSNSGGKPSKRAKSESAEPPSPTEHVPNPFASLPPLQIDGSALFNNAPLSAEAEERPSPVRAIPGFIAQTFPAPNMYVASDSQPDWAAAAAAQRCAATNALNAGRTALLGPAAAAASAVPASGAGPSGAQPTPIPVKALIGQHSAATLAAHGRPVVTATVPLPSYSGIITKRSRGRRVPNDPLEMANLGKGGKIWTCLVPECGKCFRRSEHLKRHIRSIHTEERPYMCSYPGCKKGFSRHDNLNQHMRVHQLTDGSDAVPLPVGAPSPSSSATSSTSGRKRKQPGDVEEEDEIDDDMGGEDSEDE
ncbi:hypothetical protein OC845_003354 [Tilletia horrida]|nr:hypothetical protein OC845_003354 [Tilletia horrida]